MTQLMRSGDCSIVMIDLKADDQHIFETLRVEAQQVPDRVRQRTGEEPKFSEYPFRWFTTVLGRSSFAFNPVSQVVMKKLSPDQRTDALTAALGLQYGTDYGRKYYSDANYDLLNYALRENPNVTSLAELDEILEGANRFPLPEETRKASLNVRYSVRRLGRSRALNACLATGTPQPVIDFSQVFQQPQAVYFALPPSAGISTTAEMARLALYSLLASADAVDGPRHQVFLIVDEFQRIVSGNVELFFQQARSRGIGCIFANQSLSDLTKGGIDILSAVRTNTRFRQVFAAGNPNEIQDLIDTAGESVYGMRSWKTDVSAAPSTATEMQLTESVGPRLSTNDILKASDAEGRSITYVRRGAGYAQFGGILTTFHAPDGSRFH